MRPADQKGHQVVARHIRHAGDDSRLLDQSEVIVAALQGDLERLQKLLELGADANAGEGEALAAAAERGQFGAVKLLHEHGANIRIREDVALRRAAAYGQLEMVKYLHRNGADVCARDGEALGLAARGGHGNVVRYLHRSGASRSTLSTESRAEIAQMQEEIRSAAEIYHPSRFWEVMNRHHSTLLAWGGDSNFKRTVNQAYFNFIPESVFELKIVNLLRLWLRFRNLQPFACKIEDPDRDPELWFSWYEGYLIFKRNRNLYRRFYKWFVGSLYEYALRTDTHGVLARLDEPELGNPIRIWRRGRLISQDLVNSVCERNSIVDGVRLVSGMKENVGAKADQPLTIAELGAGYGRLGYVVLATTKWRYMVFDIPPALHIAQWYLSHLFPEKHLFRFRHFSSYSEIASELAQADLAFFTPNQLEMFPDRYLDAFATVSSLHEMRKEQIEHFVTLFSAKTRDVIYIKQQKHYVNPHDGLHITKSDYALPLEWRLVTERSDALNPDFFERVLLRDKADPLAITDRRNDIRRPTVSILLCNYNHAKYLPDSLGAICHQTRAPEEVIVVDDGSTDNSVEVIESFARRYPFVEVLRNEGNRGLMYSIQRALRRASKDYIVWASADDKLLPNFLERSVSVLSTYSGAGVCFSRLAVLEDGTNNIREYLGDVHTGPAFDLGTEAHFLAPEALKSRLTRYYLWMSGNTVVARRDAVLEAGAFRPELEWHTDWFAFYIVALRYGACVVPETLAIMREVPGIRSSSAMWDPNRQKRVLKALASIIKEPQYRDVAPVFRSCPALLSPFGGLMLKVLAAKPAYWDLGWRYLQWALAYRATTYLGRARAGSGSVRLKLKGAAFRAAARAVNGLTPFHWKN